MSIDWHDPEEAEELNRHVPARRPAGDRNSRVSFESEVEAEQTDRLAAQMTDQVSQTFAFAGRTIIHSEVRDGSGWKPEDRCIILTFRDGGKVRIFGRVEVVT